MSAALDPTLPTALIDRCRRLKALVEPAAPAEDATRSVVQDQVTITSRPLPGGSTLLQEAIQNPEPGVRETKTEFYESGGSIMVGETVHHSAGHTTETVYVIDPRRGTIAEVSQEPEPLPDIPYLPPARREGEPVVAGVYPMEVTWLGRTHRFSIEITPQLAAACQARDIYIVLDDARGVSPDREYTFNPTRGINWPGPGEPPAWQLTFPPLGVGGLPQDRLILDLGPALPNGELNLTMRAVGGLDYGFDVRHPPTAPRPPLPESAYVPLNVSNDAVPLAADVSIWGLNPAERELAREAFNHVCGAALQRWPERQQRLRDERAAADISPLRARYIDLTLAPVELVIVPEGKHWTAMPQLDAYRDDAVAMQKLGWTLSQQRDVRAAIVRTDEGTKVFLPASDLKSEKQGDSRHELYHLLAWRYMDEADLQQIEASYRKTRETGGTFAMTYGIRPDEYFTTMSEVFEGTHRADGPQWLRANHEDLYRIFSKETGRDPANIESRTPGSPRQSP